MARYQFISIFFIVLLIFIAYQFLLILSPFTKSLFWAAILAFALHPLYLWIKKKMTRRSPAAAAAVTTLLALCIVLPIVFFLVTKLADEGGNFVEWASTAIQNGGPESAYNKALSLPVIREIVEIGQVRKNLPEWSVNTVKTLAGATAGQAAEITKNIFLFIINFFFTFFLLFFCLKDGQNAVDFIYDITPLEEPDRKNIFCQINDTFTAVIHGQILSAFIQSVIAGVLFAALGLRFAVLFASFVFFAALIPFLGAPIVWVPIAVYMLANEMYVKAAVLTAIGAGVIGMVDNIVHPILIGKRTRLPYLLLLLGIIGGLQIYGLMGIFLGPTVMSVFFVLISIYRQRFLKAKNA